MLNTKNEFYKAYHDMSYEAAYAYEKSKIEMQQLPSIIQHLQENENKLKVALDEKKTY